MGRDARDQLSQSIRSGGAWASSSAKATLSSLASRVEPSRTMRSLLTLSYGPSDCPGVKGGVSGGVKGGVNGGVSGGAREGVPGTLASGARGADEHGGREEGERGACRFARAHEAAMRMRYRLMLEPQALCGERGRADIECVRRAILDDMQRANLVPRGGKAPRSSSYM